MEECCTKFGQGKHKLDTKLRQQVKQLIDMNNMADLIYNIR